MTLTLRRGPRSSADRPLAKLVSLLSAPGLGIFPPYTNSSLMGIKVPPPIIIPKKDC